MVDFFEALATLPVSRSEHHLQVLLDFFGSSIAKMRDLAPSQTALHVECCRYLQKVELQPNVPLCQQGAVGGYCFFSISGNARVEVDGSVKQYTAGPGAVHCEDAVHDGIHTAYGCTVIPVNACVFAALSKSDYWSVLGKLESEVIAALKVFPKKRTDQHLKLLQTLFRKTDFFESLEFGLLQRQACRHMGLKDVASGEHVFTQGEHGNEFFILLSGSATVSVNDVRVATLQAGASFGEMAVMGETEAQQQRTATVTATEHCVLGSLSRQHYTVRSFPSAGRPCSITLRMQPPYDYHSRWGCAAEARTARR
jgi:CRP-like cAMP-binding protein